jgi:hypothetical protein
MVTTNYLVSNEDIVQYVYTDSAADQLENSAAIVGDLEVFLLDWILAM